MSDLKIMFTFIMSDKGPNFLCDWTPGRTDVRTRLRGPKFSDRHAKSIDALRASIIIGYASDDVVTNEHTSERTYIYK
jgi:hypothetical protein